MKSKYLRLFVCRKLVLVKLLCLYTLTGFAQPPCGTPVPGKISVGSDITKLCPGNDLKFDFKGSSADPSLLFFLQTTSSLSQPFAVASGPTNDPDNNQLTTNAVAGANYYRVAAMCLYTGVFTPCSDTIIVTSSDQMIGTYTINAGLAASATNFTSFSAAVEKLTTSCIAGPIVFEVTSNNTTYKEQVVIPNLDGTSDINTITFNCNGNTLSYAGTGYYDSRYIIKLDGADHIIFDSLQINAATGQSGYGVVLTNDADFNIIRRCVINAGANSNFSGYAGIVVSGADNNEGWTDSNCDENLFEGNTITGGYTGISITGNGNKNRIINNDIRDVQTRGIYISSTTETTVSGNRISRPKRTVLGLFYGVFAESSSYGLVISDNRVFNLSGGDVTSGAQLYGIYFSGCDADISSPNKVYNNLFYKFNGTGPIAALYNGSSDYVSYYHNTIYFDNAVSQTSTQPSAGVFLNADVTGVEFINNIVVMAREGAGDKYGIYKRTSAINCSSDNNDFYMLPLPSHYVGYNGTSQGTMLNWRAASGGDLASVTMDPLFLNVKEDNFKPNNTQLDNKGVSVGIEEDIAADTRSTTVPDIGAYEFSHLTCSSPPAAATVTVSQNPICSADILMLGGNGGELGDGITYQWQSSVDNSAWTNIATATSKETTVSQTTDTWYRLVSTCGAGSTPSDAYLVRTMYGAEGTFTINKAVATGGKNFQSFTEAWNAIKCGITAPVVFDVVPGSGPYNEQLLTSAVKGASAINTITIKGNGNTLEFQSDNAFERAVIKLNGTDHLIIDSLVIKASAASAVRYGYGIHLVNDADSNIIRNCTIYSDTTLGLYDRGYSGIVVNGAGNINPEFGEAFSDDNVFEGNTIVGGYYGLALIGSSTKANTRNIIRRNSFTNFLVSGIYSSNAVQTIIDSNIISRPTRVGVSTFNGIYLTNGQLANIITRNRISNAFGGVPESTDDFYGINLYFADASQGMENIVSNNVIYNITGGGTVYGLYNYSSDRVWYYHNTIQLDGAGLNSYNNAYGFYQTSAANAIRFRNNVVTVERGGDGKKYAVYFGTPESVINSDNNDLFIVPGTTNANIGFSNNTDRKILANCKIGGNEANSTSVDPAYVDKATGNLQPKNAAINNAGQALPVTVDVNGVARNATAPDMGAYEFNPAPCTAPVVTGTSVASDDDICEGNKVELNLAGNSIGGDQTYQWQAATSADGNFGAISNTQASPLFGITPGTDVLYYRAAVTCAGTTSYSQPITVNVNAMLPGGTYTIDQNGTGNFRSFNEAKAAMACGIKGPVVFNVLPGGLAYNEQLILDTIVGSSAVNTVTFKGNGDTILYSSTDYDFPAVITLNKTDNVIFDSLVISAVGTGYYGLGVFVTNNADNNTFRKCTILIPQTSSSSSYSGVVIGGSTSPTSLSNSFCDNNLFQGNTIIGGYCGMSMMGGMYSPHTGNKFIGNTITDVYSYGIYVGASVNAVIEGNTISRPTRKSIGLFYGIYASGSSTYSLSMNHGLQISKNRIHTAAGGNAASTSACYGIYLSNNDAYNYNPVTVSNNLVYNFNGAGAVYGIYNSSSDNVRYYHNTISLDNKNYTGATAAYGIYQTLSVTGLDIKNNIITVLRGGTGSKFGLYFPNTATFTSDYNNIWVDAGTNKFVGYFGANKATLTDWQGISLTNTDKNSVSVNPTYEDTATGKFKPTLADIDNTGTVVGVASDLYNVARSTSKPDIGAIEFSSSPCTSPPTAGDAVINPASGMCIGTTVQLTLTGNSVGGSQKYLWQRAASEAGPWTNISDTSAASDYGYELLSRETYFRAVVVCGTGVAYSKPAQLVINGGLMAGDYTIDPALPAGSGNFQSFKEAIAAMQCGIEGSVRFLTVPGTYKERVRVPKIPGTSASATVTFLSRDNNAASVIVTDSCTADSNYVVKMDTTNYITFKNMTIKPQGTEFARAVEFAGTSSADSITGCVIDLPAVVNTSDNVVGIYGNEVSGEKNVLSKNTITNGMAGVYLEGISLYANKFVIDSNTITNSYYYNVYARNINSLSVSGNTIVKNGVQNVPSYGMWIQKCDSAYKIDKNNITITNAGGEVDGIIIFVSAGGQQEKGSISGNRIIADNTNTGSIYGLRCYTSTINYNAMNNVIVISTKGGQAYGIYSGGRGGVNYYNNSVLIESATAQGAAAVISESDYTYGGVGVYNNIFANTGGGAAMEMFSPLTNSSDYNLLYSAGPALMRYRGTDIANLKQWQDVANWDYSSLVYKPVFADNKTLMPDVTKAEVWAIHGRGVQITADSVDITGAKRPITLQTGVPDLGAYEFVPTVSPVVLTAFPATPAPNSKQTFMLGTDTVTQITWGSTVPASIEGKRFSGVAPEGLTAGQPYMYFYTAFTTTGTAPKGHAVKQFYVDSWRGTIDNEKTIKLGKTNAAVWEISAKSRLDTVGNSVADTGLTVLAKFTGLTDGKEAPTNPVVINTRDTSSRGTRFWAPYANTVLFNDRFGNSQSMAIYIGAGAQEAHVTIRVNGTSWIKQYTVPANTAITSDLIPKAGAFDARLLQEGLSDRGISIESDAPVSAYAHIYGPSASAATMLLPVGTYGYEYYTLTGRQTYNAGGYNASVVNVIAAYDSTVVEITPSVPTQGGREPNKPFRVMLRKGQVYQLMGAIDANMEVSYDLTGTKIRSVKNDNDKCWPIAVFSGSNLTGFDCSLIGSGGTGDNILQQNFPYQAWGKKYLTAPTSHYTDAKRLMTNVYRVSVKDPTTIVELNGTQLTTLINNSYYEFASSTADYVKADKPIMVAQFQPSAHTCGVTDSMGDPEMFYLSPIEQGVKEAQLYRNTTDKIVFQYLTLVIPNNGLSSLTVDGINSYDYSYPHPNLAGYTVVVKRWTAAKTQSVVRSDSSFTAITYGMGEYESYGYNAGTMVLNLNTRVSISNTQSPSGGYSDYTCAGTPFKLSLITTVEPTAIDWKLSGVAQMVPNTDVHEDKPKAVDTLDINGITYYKYILDKEYEITAAGEYTVSAFITHPDIDACDSRQETLLPIKVMGAPVVDFVTSGSCAGSETQFAGSAELANSSPIVSWTWNFDDAGAGSHAKDTVHTYSKAGEYNVKLDVIDANGCVGDTTKAVVIKAPLAAPTVKTGVITSFTITFMWDAIPGATGYEVSLDNGLTWITPSSGATGVTHTVTGLQLGQTVTIKVRTLGSCVPAESVAVAATTMVQEVFVPNSFSPDNNGPAENEYFKIYGNSIKQLRLMIFNQWGEKVFESNNQANGWDGRYKGKPQPSGVYIYVADVLLDNNKRETKKGTVNLIR